MDPAVSTIPATCDDSGCWMVPSARYSRWTITAANMTSIDGYIHVDSSEVSSVFLGAIAAPPSVWDHFGTCISVAIT